MKFCNLLRIVLILNMCVLGMVEDLLSSGLFSIFQEKGLFKGNEFFYDSGRMHKDGRGVYYMKKLGQLKTYRVSSSQVLFGKH